MIVSLLLFALYLNSISEKFASILYSFTNFWAKILILFFIPSIDLYIVPVLSMIKTISALPVVMFSLPFKLDDNTSAESSLKVDFKKNEFEVVTSLVFKSSLFSVSFITLL